MMDKTLISELEERAPFDPGCPFDAMSELFRVQVTDLAIKAQKVTIYRDMDHQSQLECFIAGALTGLVGVCFASIHPEDKDAIMDYLVKCLPVARLFAEGIRHSTTTTAGDDGHG